MYYVTRDKTKLLVASKQYAIGSGPKFTWMSKAAATNHMFVERYKNSGQNMTRAEAERAVANLMTDDLGPNGARRYLVPIGDYLEYSRKIKSSSVQ